MPNYTPDVEKSSFRANLYLMGIYVTLIGMEKCQILKVLYIKKTGIVTLGRLSNFVSNLRWSEFFKAQLRHPNALVTAFFQDPFQSLL